MKYDFNPEYVDLVDVPMQQNQGRSIWLQRFNALPDNKAAMLRYNNRQRAHQVRCTIKSIAKYLNMAISTRIIHAEPAIHDTDGWLVYFWKRLDEAKK